MSYSKILQTQTQTGINVTFRIYDYEYYRLLLSIILLQDRSIQLWHSTTLCVYLPIQF